MSTCEKAKGQPDGGDVEDLLKLSVIRLARECDIHAGHKVDMRPSERASERDATSATDDVCAVVDMCYFRVTEER